jgi:hypothetical protein
MKTAARHDQKPNLKQKPKQELVGFWLDEGLKKQLQARALREQRSVSGVLRMLVLRALTP